MRRFTVTLRGFDFNKTESFNTANEATKTAKRWTACYDGVVTITDNATGKAINI